MGLAPRACHGLRTGVCLLKAVPHGYCPSPVPTTLSPMCHRCFTMQPGAGKKASGSQGAHIAAVSCTPTLLTTAPPCNQVLEKELAAAAKEHHTHRILVFCETKRGCDEVSRGAEGVGGSWAGMGDANRSGMLEGAVRCVDCTGWAGVGGLWRDDVVGDGRWLVMAGAARAWGGRGGGVAGAARWQAR